MVARRNITLAAPHVCEWRTYTQCIGTSYLHGNFRRPQPSVVAVAQTLCMLCLGHSRVLFGERGGGACTQGWMWGGREHFHLLAPPIVLFALPTTLGRGQAESLLACATRLQTTSCASVHSPKLRRDRGAGGGGATVVRGHDGATCAQRPPHRVPRAQHTHYTLATRRVCPSACWGLRCCRRGGGT